jgi:hypothetical protein
MILLSEKFKDFLIGWSANAPTTLLCGRFVTYSTYTRPEKITFFMRSTFFLDFFTDLKAFFLKSYMAELFLFLRHFDPSSLKWIFVNDIIKKYSRQSQTILVRRTIVGLLAEKFYGSGRCYSCRTIQSF